MAVEGTMIHARLRAVWIGTSVVPPSGTVGRLLIRLRPIKVTVSPAGAAAAAIVGAIGDVVQVAGCQGGGSTVWLTQLWS